MSMCQRPVGLISGRLMKKASVLASAASLLSTWGMLKWMNPEECISVKML